MRKTALGLILAGQVFTGFAVYFSGVDILIDAVGFLLIFNGARALAKYGDNMGPCAPLCLGLVAVAALQIFLGAAAGLVLLALRAVGEAALYLLLARGLAGLPSVRAIPALGVVLRVIFAGCAAGLVLAAALAIFVPGGPAAAGVSGTLFWLRAAAMAVLLWAAITANDSRESA